MFMNTLEKIVELEIESVSVYPLAGLSREDFEKDDYMTYSQRYDLFDEYYKFFIENGYDDNITPKQALEIGARLVNEMELFKNYQVLLATHCNEEHLHTHIIVQSVNHTNGQKWQRSPKDLQAIKDKSDELCKEYGLNVIEKDSKGYKSYGEHSQNSWKEAVAKDIVRAMETATSKDEFNKILFENGVVADIGWKTTMFYLSEQYGEYLKLHGVNSFRDKIGSKKLNTYGDFSRESIKSNIEFNYNNHMLFKDLDSINNMLLEFEYGQNKNDNLDKVEILKELKETYQDKYYAIVDKRGKLIKNDKLARDTESLKILVNELKSLREELRKNKDLKKFGIVFEKIDNSVEKDFRISNDKADMESKKILALEMLSILNKQYASVDNYEKLGNIGRRFGGEELSKRSKKEWYLLNKDKGLER